MLPTPDRRQFLKTAAGAALPLVVASSLPASQPAAIPSHADCGNGHARLRGPHQRPTGQGVERTGHSCHPVVPKSIRQPVLEVQRPVGRSDLTADRCQAIADTYRSAGITIHSIGVYTNLIHPDEAERRANSITLKP